MRTIRIPDSVPIVQLDGAPVLEPSGEQVTVSFAAFVRERSCDPAFAGDGGFTMQAVLAAVRVSEACAAEPNTEVRLDEADWVRLERATQSPQGGYHPAVARCLLPHMAAIVNAVSS